MVDVYQSEIEDSFDIIMHLLKKVDNIDYNKGFIEILSSEGLSNGQRIKLIRAIYKKKPGISDRRPHSILKKLDEIPFTKDQKDIVIHETFKALKEDHYLAQKRLLEMLEKDKKIKGRKEMLKAMTTEPRFKLFKYDARKIIEKERPRKWYEIF